MRRRPPPFSWILPLLLGCTEPRVLNIEVVTGHETDAMTQDPPVATVVVRGETPEGTLIEAEAAPGGALDFGDIDGDLAYSFETTGYDGAGNVVMRGRSVSGIILNEVGGDTFQIFAQRLGAWARPPGELAHTHTRAPAISDGIQSLYMTGGDAPEDATEAEIYDLFAWAGASGDKLPFAATALFPDVSSLLVLGSEQGNEAGVLTSSGFTSTGIPLPEGLTSFGELAGGMFLPGADGRVFLIGPTRLGTPTDAVLEIAADGTLIVRRLLQKRAGAAATWVQDLGLVILGGSADGSGVEILGENATTFAVRDFPPDPTAGAAAVPGDNAKLILVGGTTPDAPARTRTLDPTCTDDCQVEELPAATPEPALTRVSAYPLGNGRLIAVGDEPSPSDLTRTFILNYLTQTVTELPLREPRRGATAVATPLATLAIMGGIHPDGSPALTVEMLFPE